MKIKDDRKHCEKKKISTIFQNIIRIDIILNSYLCSDSVVMVGTYDTQFNNIYFLFYFFNYYYYSKAFWLSLKEQKK